MSSTGPSHDSMHAFIHRKFHDAFGPPQNVQGGAQQWTLESSTQYPGVIHVLLNGTPSGPNVWIFDPTNAINGVVNTAVAQERQVNELINLIQQRLNMASWKNGQVGGSSTQATQSNQGPIVP